MTITISKESLEKFQEMKNLEPTEIALLSGTFNGIETSFICRVAYDWKGEMKVTPLYIEFQSGMESLAAGPNGEPLTENGNGT